jgi:WhiB family redox-sensing transcriptional regulator
MTSADFMADGLCAQTGPEAFHPERREPAAPAIAVCRRCPVRAACLEYALTHDERFGVWGGVPARARARLRRDRALPSRAERVRAEKRDAARRIHRHGAGKTAIATALGLSGTRVNAYLADDPKETT